MTTFWATATLRITMTPRYSRPANLLVVLPAPGSSRSENGGKGSRN